MILYEIYGALLGYWGGYIFEYNKYSHKKIEVWGDKARKSALKIIIQQILCGPILIIAFYVLFSLK